MAKGKIEIPIEDLYLQPRKNSTENMDSIFLLEVEGVCPKCGKPLMTKKGTRGHKLYQIAHIYPNKPTLLEKNILYGLERLGKDCEDFANKIALCKDCHGYYDDHKTTEEYLWFVARKKEILARTSLKSVGFDFKLEDEIKLVVECLAKLSSSAINQLDYKGVQLARKILDSEFLLKAKITNYVILFFFYIQDTFLELNTTKQLNFNLIAHEVKSYFLKCEAEGTNQSQIFNIMVDWIKSKTMATSIEACEAVVSFFIQDCEVFREISE